MTTTNSKRNTTGCAYVNIKCVDNVNYVNEMEYFNVKRQHVKVIEIHFCTDTNVYDIDIQI